MRRTTLLCNFNIINTTWPEGGACSNAKCVWCILWIPVSSYPGTHRGTQTMNFSDPSGKRRTKKIMAFKKRKHCRGPHALEVTNLNAVASNLPRTCFKRESLPNSVIFITEVHLHLFLTLCSSSNLGKSL